MLRPNLHWRSLCLRAHAVAMRAEHVHILDI